MTTPDEFIAQYNLSGPEEYCNTIARMDMHLSDVISRMGKAVNKVRSYDITDEAYRNNDQIPFLCDLTASLINTATAHLEEAMRHGISDGPSDKLYHFLLTGAIGFEGGIGFGGRYSLWSDEAPDCDYTRLYEAICTTTAHLIEFGHQLHDQILDEQLTDEVIDQHIADMEASLM